MKYNIDLVEYLAFSMSSRWGDKQTGEYTETYTKKKERDLDNSPTMTNGWMAEIMISKKKSQN